MFAVIILSSPSVQNVCEYVRICDQSGCESLSALQQHSPAGAVAVSPRVATHVPPVAMQ